MRKAIIASGGLALTTIVIGIFIFFYNGGSFINTSSAAVVVPFTRIVQGDHSIVATRVNYLISSTDEFDKLWEMVDASGTPPLVDFNTHAVIAVFAGEQPTAGYAIEVSQIEDSTERTVSLTLAKPDNDCMEGQVITSPYEIVVVPTTSLPLTHEDIQTTANCPK